MSILQFLQPRAATPRRAAPCDVAVHSGELAVCANAQIRGRLSRASLAKIENLAAKRMRAASYAFPPTSRSGEHTTCVSFSADGLALASCNLNGNLAVHSMHAWDELHALALNDAEKRRRPASPREQREASPDADPIFAMPHAAHVWATEQRLERVAWDPSAPTTVLCSAMTSAQISFYDLSHGHRRSCEQLREAGAYYGVADFQFVPESGAWSPAPPRVAWRAARACRCAHVSTPSLQAGACWWPAAATARRVSGTGVRRVAPRACSRRSGAARSRAAFCSGTPRS